jgi:hypothetical protein
MPWFSGQFRHAKVTHGTSLISLGCDPPAIDFDANLVTLPAGSSAKKLKGAR